MSVKSEPYYWLECDRCGVKSTEGGEFTAWGDITGAMDDATDSDWLLTGGGHHYCSECVTVDEETDELVPRSKETTE